VSLLEKTRLNGMHTHTHADIDIVIKYKEYPNVQTNSKQYSMQIDSVNENLSAEIFEGGFSIIK
jgi:hypothetical protein